jgi:hypothetical protein
MSKGATDCRSFDNDDERFIMVFSLQLSTQPVKAMITQMMKKEITTVVPLLFFPIKSNNIVTLKGSHAEKPQSHTTLDL